MTRVLSASVVLAVPQSTYTMSSHSDHFVDKDAKQRNNARQRFKPSSGNKVMFGNWSVDAEKCSIIPDDAEVKTISW